MMLPSRQPEVASSTFPPWRGHHPNSPKSRVPGVRSPHDRTYNYRMNPPGETPAGYPER